MNIIHIYSLLGVIIYNLIDYIYIYIYMAICYYLYDFEINVANLCKLLSK